MKLSVKLSESNQSFAPKLGESSQSFDTKYNEVQIIHGRDGEDGKSAYEIALANGFEGTEAAWLDSLHGRDGKDGRNGIDGKDGYTPQKNIDYFDGKDGKDGQPGKDGVDGKTPVKGTDYYTEADKAEMVSAVISALPKYDGEVVAV